MKKMYVSVAEFLKHGGVLEKGRALYTKSLTKVYLVSHVLYGSVEVGGGVDNYVIDTKDILIQIPCTPHYV